MKLKTKILISLVSLFICFLLINQLKSKSIVFNKLEWNSNKTDIKLQVTDDLLMNHLKKGMLKTDIVQLLGEQDFVGHPIVDYDKYEVYFLGRTDNFFRDVYHVLFVEYKDSIAVDFIKTYIDGD